MATDDNDSMVVSSSCRTSSVAAVLLLPWATSVATLLPMTWCGRLNACNIMMGIDEYFLLLLEYVYDSEEQRTLQL